MDHGLLKAGFIRTISGYHHLALNSAEIALGGSEGWWSSRPIQTLDGKAPRPDA
jgi:hypothetical protein